MLNNKYMLKLEDLQINKLKYIKSYIYSLIDNSELIHFYKYNLNNIYILIEIKTKENFNNDEKICNIVYYIQKQYININIPQNQKDISCSIYWFQSHNFNNKIDQNNFIQFELDLINNLLSNLPQNLPRFHTLNNKNNIITDLEKIKLPIYRKNKINKLLQ